MFVVVVVTDGRRLPESVGGLSAFHLTDQSGIANSLIWCEINDIIEGGFLLLCAEHQRAAVCGSEQTAGRVKRNQASNLREAEGAAVCCG